MYELPPARLWREPPQIPRVMYELPPNSSPALDLDPVAAALEEQKPNGDMAALEERQKRLLEKLESLQAQMENTKRTILLGSGPAVKKSFKSNNSLPKDVVINTCPEFIPFYLLKLKKLLNMKITCHTHSSVTSLPQAVTQFSNAITKDNPASPDFVATLIWKNVAVCTELVLSSIPIVIAGDINVLRYLVAAIPCKLSYKDTDSANSIDSLLDCCHSLQSQKSNEDRRMILQSLSSKLGKGSWLGESSEISIADFAAWNTIKQLNCQSEVGNLKGWFQNCEKISIC